MAVLVRRLGIKGLRDRDAAYDSITCRTVRPTPGCWPFNEGRLYIDKPLGEWDADELAIFHRVKKVPPAQVADRRLQANKMLTMSASDYILWHLDRDAEIRDRITEYDELNDPRLLAPEADELVQLQAVDRGPTGRSDSGDTKV